jgi:HK97 family phage prohead protease
MARAKKIHFQCLSSVVKSAEDGGVYIEGYANRKTVDRADEIIEHDAWFLEDYKKNPVILYNHGMDGKIGATPIGKCEKIDPRTDGLFVKVKMSGVDDPDIKRVRDLVKEGMLRAFSVGFNCRDSQVDEKGIRRIKKADLFEISIVGVPMNQDSLFSLTGKMITTKSIDQIGAKVCNKKGALAAGMIHMQMHEMQADGEKKRDDLLAMVAEKAGVEVEVLKPILAGDVTPIPENVLAAFAEVLGIDLEKLKQAEAEKEQPEDDTEETEPEVEVEVEVTEEEKAAMQDCVSAKVPKLLEEGMSQEQAVAVALDMCSKEKRIKQADQEGVSPLTTEIAASKTGVENDDFGSPYLDAQKQTNVLLGALIAEVQKLSTKMDQSQGAEQVQEKQPEPKEEATQENQKAALDSFNERLENCIKRLKALGV